MDDSSEKEHQPQGICARKLRWFPYTRTSIIDKVPHILCSSHMDLLNILTDFMIESTGSAWPLWWVSLAKPLKRAKAIITIQNNNTFYLTKC